MAFLLGAIQRIRDTLGGGEVSRKLFLFSEKCQKSVTYYLNGPLCLALTLFICELVTVKLSVRICNV